MENGSRTSLGNEKGGKEVEGRGKGKTSSMVIEVAVIVSR